MILDLLILVAMGSFIGWFVVHTYTTYKAETGTVLQRLYAATKDSATIFWGTVILCVTDGYNFVLNIADFFGMQEFKDFITLHFSVQWASAILAGSVFILIVARLRSLGK